MGAAIVRIPTAYVFRTPIGHASKRPGDRSAAFRRLNLKRVRAPLLCCSNVFPQISCAISYPGPKNCDRLKKFYSSATWTVEVTQGCGYEEAVFGRGNFTKSVF